MWYTTNIIGINSMRKTFLFNFLFLLYIEIVFHIACFKQLNVLDFLLILLSSIIFSGIITFLCSITKKENNKQITII